ncbi:DUF2628 domain-containing protein [Sporolactobacillus shoreicorticis]|uniref:DUF2628 domain-containing protein n=1 Tax=Sporolactobacillus shoreicorticis TaxID=1923877 RepID=A0ABW5S4V8_9BACL|nr:DUF2628 domain-containing protein [Sporolactobacillus shoreicorticis]MCO7125423.1 DUF2628 domain-containing protein [Sporolactobacillus shoreicorticis]
MSEWNTHYLDLSEETRQELLLYLGKHEDTYERRWTRMSDKKRSFSWHWPAFFVFTYWAAHRKMYMIAYGYLVISTILELIFKDLPNSFAWSFSLVVAIICALYSNHLCFLYSLKEIRTLKAQIPDRDERIHHLRTCPGYSWPAFWLFFVIDFGVTIILNFI